MRYSSYATKTESPWRGQRFEDPDSLEWVAAPATGCEADGVFHVATVTEALTLNGDPPLTDGPIGGGLASGTGAQVDLTCPEGVDEETTEWVGPATLTRRGAVAEAFGDLVVGWIGEPLRDRIDRSLVDLGTQRRRWQPRRGGDRCRRQRRLGPQSCPVLHHPATDAATSAIHALREQSELRGSHRADHDHASTSVVVVEQDFDVEGQHNWITFEPEVIPGRTHTPRHLRHRR